MSIGKVGKLLAKRKSLGTRKGHKMDRVKFPFIQLTQDFERIDRIFNRLERIEKQFEEQTLSRIHEILDRDNRRILKLFADESEEAWPAMVTELLDYGLTRGYIEHKGFDYRYIIFWHFTLNNPIRGRTPQSYVGHTSDNIPQNEPLRESPHVASPTPIQNNVTNLSATSDLIASPEENPDSREEPELRDPISSAVQQAFTENQVCSDESDDRPPIPPRPAPKGSRNLESAYYGPSQMPANPPTTTHTVGQGICPFYFSLQDLLDNTQLRDL